ncbi:MAG: hypothetical protein AMJ79_03450 [Phycisphaerae bacterium SM23_30]|nr:MAG: hypothetical protein AMJ79_03450 [Phycisphaerae bacterium SM23_30]
MENSVVSLITKYLSEAFITSPPGMILYFASDYQLNTVAYWWHFPGADENRRVIPDSGDAKRKIREGINSCDIKKFAMGLHPLQDSWSHQSGIKKPPVEDKVGHSRDIKGWYWEHWENPGINSPNINDIPYLPPPVKFWINRQLEYDLAPPGTKKGILKALRQIRVFLSPDTDIILNFRTDAKETARATYREMQRFMRSCCRIKSPRNYSGKASRCRCEREDEFREYLGEDGAFWPDIK